MRVGKRSLTLFTAVLAALGWWFISYHTWEYRGSGRIYDSGIFSYYRYHVELGHIPLAEGGEHRFEAYGLPGVRMVLQLKVVDPKKNDTQLLSSLTTRLETKVTDSSGRTLCFASGRISDTKDGKQVWILGGASPAFYNLNCVDVPIQRKMHYVVQVVVQDIDARSPQTSLVPTLEGGGIELP